MNMTGEQELATDPHIAVQRLMQKAHNRDGLPEMAIGAIFITTACLMWLQCDSAPGSFARWAGALGLIFLVAPMCGGAQWAIRWLRRRFLTDKVGYVKFKPLPRKQLLLIICTAAIIAMVALLFVYRGWMPPRGWILAGTGILGGFLMIVAGRLLRYVVWGISMAAVGIALGFSRASLEMGFLILYGSVGALLFASGSLALLRLLRTPKEDAE